ncbi:MAG: hypothetical protein IKP68_09110 [Clostridia bacterium]|nr:hypothetical protein [Clostridia bacterium]
MKTEKPKKYYKKAIYICCIFFVLLSVILFLIISIVSGFFQNMLNNIASVVLVSGIYTIFYEFLIKERFADEIISKVRLKNKIDSFGIGDIGFALREIDFQPYILSAKNIDILHIEGKHWTDEYIDIIKESKQKKQIRVCLLSPNSSFYEAIARHYSKSKEEMMREKTKKVTEEWKSCISNKRLSFSIRFFDGVPAHSIYRFDNKIIIVFSNILSDLTKKLPYMIFEKKSDDGIYDVYKNEFENIWEKSCKDMEK